LTVWRGDSARRAAVQTDAPPRPRPGAGRQVARGRFSPEDAFRRATMGAGRQDTRRANRRPQGLPIMRCPGRVLAGLSSLPRGNEAATLWKVRRVSELASGLTRNQVPLTGLRVRIPCPPLANPLILKGLEPVRLVTGCAPF